jgi:hypothetical protein
VVGPAAAGAAPGAAPGAAAAPGGKAGAESGPPAPEAEPPAPEGEAPARETPMVPKEVQEYLDASRGKGGPLPEKARKSFEAKYQRPFDDVTIHDDAAADDAAKRIDALAFTRGTDIYFRSGAYDPESAEGKKLLAHELAHVVQQRPGVNRRVQRKAAGVGADVVRRAKPKAGGSGSDDKNKKAGDKKQFKNADGEIDLDKSMLRLEKVRLPAFKLPHHTGTLTWKKTERSGKHADTWKTAATNELKKPVSDHAVSKKGKQKAEPFYLQHGKTEKDTKLFVGGAEDVASALSTLPWDKDGKDRKFQIDHKKELQLGGDDTNMDNLWLLDASINMSSGSTIQASIKADIEAFLKVASPELTRTPPFEEVKGWAGKGGVTFTSAIADPRTGDKAPKAVTATSPASWEKKDLPTATMDPLKPMTAANKKKAKGSKDELALYSKRGGGTPRTVHQDGGKIDVKPLWGRGYKVLDGTYIEGEPPRSGNVGGINVAFFEGEKGNKVLGPAKVGLPIQAMPGVDYGGLLDTSAIREIQKSLSAKAFSPLELPLLEFDLGDGMTARGKIPKPSIKLLERVEIEVFVGGDDIGLEATITGGELQLPGPFKVTGGALVLTASAKEGLKVEGGIDFEIKNLATGSIKAQKGTSTSFAVDAELVFDKKMFDGDATIKGSYKDGAWAIEGKLGVGPDKIKGIKKASATVKVTDKEVTATGEFETSIKGVDKGTVGFKYNEATGMEITGEIILGKGIPGVKSGKLSATIKEGKDGFSLSGGVTIEPSVPGITGSITGTYEDGAFLVEAELGYDKGRAKGKVKIGVTNQPVGADGKPAGPPSPDGALTAYGGGSVTLTITPWLQGTVGLQLKPNGEIEVSGEVKLPSAFDVFPEKKIEKKIFSIGIDIPIVGVAVAGQRIGIFATIRGGLDISAGFGPGQLKDVGLKVTYNPDRPDDTTVTGTGTFFIPASAGLRLHVDGGLGVGIPIVSATAGVSIFGEIGLAGHASAGATINWSPKTGIVLDAKGEVLVQPKFKFGIDAFVDVSADLLVTTVELYHQKWNLASFEYGSDLEFGGIFPIHYESEKPFSLSFEDMQWKYPKIDPGELLGGLMKQLVG